MLTYNPNAQEVDTGLGVWADTLYTINSRPGLFSKNLSQNQKRLFLKVLLEDRGVRERFGGMRIY